MTVISFPSNPYIGQQYTASNNIAYVWDGEKWESQASLFGAGTNYILPPATNSRLGGVQIGTGIAVDANGVISIPLLNQSDWNETDATHVDYIKNKPAIITPIQSDWNQTDNAQLDYIKNKPSVPQLPTNSSGYLSNDGVGNLTWANPTSSSAIDWTNIGYTIGQIVFDPSNKKLYYANQTFPYGTGYPPSYPGNPYFTPFTSSVTSLINNGYTVNLGTDGYLNLPNGSDGLGALIQSPSPIRINSNNNFWTFGADGNLELPGNIVADNLSIQGAPLTIIISGADWSPANVIYTRLEGATPPKWVPANYNPGLDSYITFDNDGWGLKNPVFPYPIYVGTGGLYNPSTTWASDTAHNLGNSNPTASYTYNNWTFGSDGSTSVPGSLNYNVPGLGASGEFDINSWYPVKISTGDSVNVPIKTWTFGWDGYLTGESLHLQGYLKGVDGSIGSTGQVLTRQSNGGAAWAAATGGGSSSLVNGSATLTLNSDGSVSVPLASVIKAATDSYTGIATHNMNTFAYVNADGFFVDTLYNTAEYEWHFNNTGGLTLPSSIFPITFSAVLLPIYGGAPDIGPYGGDAWTLSVTFTEDANGVVSTSVAQIFPIQNNPGYKTGDTYTFTETAHGIAGYTLTIVLDNVEYPGPAGWTANVECSAPPVSPPTIYSDNAIKISSNDHAWTFGTDGILTLPFGSTINDTPLAPGAGGNGQAVEIKPGGVSHNNQLLRIYPTAPNPDGNHLHLTSGDLTDTDLFLGDDNQFVQIAVDGKVCIGTYGTEGHFWQFGTDGSLTAPGAIYGGSNSIGLVTPAPLNLNNTGPVGQSKTQLNLINTAGNGGTGSAIDYYTYVNQGNGLPGARLSAVDDDNYSANFSIALKGRGNAGNNGLTTVWQFGSDGTLTFPNSTVQNTAWLGSTSTLVNGTSTLALNVDGTLTLPSGLTFSSGAQIFEQADHIGAGWATGLNIRGNNTTPSDPIRIYLYGEDGKGLGAGAVNVKSDRVEIYGNFQHDGVDGTFWTFSHDGSLTLPVGGAIKNSDGTTYGGTTYTLPAATSSALGGVKIGANISVTMDGTISVAAPFSGSYTDLTNKPTIPAAQVNSDWNASSGVSQILNKPSLFSGSYTDLTNTPNLATVATSGSYNDLSNKPTIGALSALNYVQVLGNTASPPSVSAGGTILSLTITTTGGPVELVGSGDANNTSAAFWGTVQWYRGASALGNQQFFESSSANENQSVTQVFIDNPAAGTYTYYWKMPRSSATITWGEGTTAPVISAKELQGIQGPTGPGMSYASGFVNAGTFVTMDNIKATVTTSGNRGLSLATVSGTATCYISGTYGMYGGSNTGGNSASFSMTTTPSNSCFGWSFGSEGDTATYILNYGYTKAYRITVMIGGAYNNNMISIERLV